MSASATPVRVPFRPWLLAKLRRIPDFAFGLVTLAFLALLRPIQAAMRRHSLVGDAEVFDLARFPWIAAVEAEYPAIRAELAAVLVHQDHIPPLQEISVESRTISTDDRWRTFFFDVWGNPVASNRARCPRTAAALDRIPGLRSAMFSILLPGKHLLPHRGLYAGLLRYHLGLIVPDETRCRMRVGAQTVHWREGGSLVFDDTAEHEAWNDTDRVRVVLLVDFIRPLPAPLAAVNAVLRGIIGRSSLVRPALRRFAAWDARMQAAWHAPR